MAMQDAPRETPTGPIPRNVRRIGIGGLALVVVVLVGILLINMTRTKSPRGAVAPARRADSIVQTAPTMPKARPEPVSVEGQRPSFARDAATMGQDPRGFGGMGEAVQKPVDPLETERKKRDFDSLYAGNVVVSFREGQQAQAQARRSDGGSRRAPAGEMVMPSTDEVAASVVRAFGGGAGLQGLQAQQPSIPPTPPPGVHETGHSGSDGRGRKGAAIPEETPPVDDSGPTHRVLESSILDAVVVNRLDGSRDSPVIAKVTNPLYSHNGVYVLVPADTKIIGETKAVQQAGESRLVVVFHRMIFPNGSTRSLDQFKGLHINGALGLKDQVNNHYLSTFGAAAAMSLVTGAGQALGNRGFSEGSGGTTVITSSVGDGVGQATSQVLNKFLNRLPTITIREGVRFRVYITSDISLPAYGH